ncbi:MAG: TatA/E family protein of Tat protein translocase [Arenicella sp.]|jgi:TatA/E family protein of Tat protein translocase
MILLFLNSLGTWEVLLIMAVVLMLFGSKGLPGIAKNLGKGMREIKTASNEIKRDIQNSAMDMKNDMGLQNPMDILPKLNDLGIDNPLDGMPKLDNILDEDPKTVKVDTNPKNTVKVDSNPKNTEEEA